MASDGIQGPKRIQRKRTKGWRMPENTVYVGRGSKWGNPYKVGIPIKEQMTAQAAILSGKVTPEVWRANEPMSPQLAFDMFIYSWVRYSHLKPDPMELRGKNLACWCGVGEPCHADALLELANMEPSS